MAIIVICPACNARLKLSDDQAGERIECFRPECDAIITVPPSTPSEEEEGVSLSDFNLLGYLILLVVGVFLLFWSFRAFLRAERSDQVAILVAVGILAFLAVASSVVSLVWKCKWLVGLAYTLMSTALTVLFVVIYAMAGRSTQQVIIAVALIIAAWGVIVTVVSFASRCSWLEAACYTAEALGGIVMAVGMAFGLLGTVFLHFFANSSTSHGHSGRVVSCRRCGTVIDNSSIRLNMHNCPVCGNFVM
jgi:hypothetical protein